MEWKYRLIKNNIMNTIAFLQILLQILLQLEEVKLEAIRNLQYNNQSDIALRGLQMQSEAAIKKLNELLNF